MVPDIPDMSLATSYRYKTYGTLVELEENILSLVPDARDRKSVFSSSRLWQAAERQRYVKRVVLGLLPMQGSGVEPAEIEEVISNRGWGLSSMLWWRNAEGLLDYFTTKA